MQVVRKSSSSKYSLRFIRATDNGTRNNRSMAIRSIGFAARYALRRSTATQSVNNLKFTTLANGILASVQYVLINCYCFCSWFQCERPTNIGCGRSKAIVYIALDFLVCFSRMCRRRNRSEEISRTTSVPVFNSYNFGKVFRFDWK